MVFGVSLHFIPIAMFNHFMVFVNYQGLILDKDSLVSFFYSSIAHVITL